jgi:hypothetical protein
VKNDEAALPGRPATVNDHPPFTIAELAARVEKLERLAAELAAPVAPSRLEDERWTEQVDRAVSRAQGRRRRGETYRFEIPPSRRAA